MSLNPSSSQDKRVEAGRRYTTTSAHLRERARQYRLAAALTDCPRDVEMFCDLAVMFNQLAHDFRRLEEKRSQALAAAEPKSSPVRSPAQLPPRGDIGLIATNGLHS
jgi:hypothetical protein